LGVTAGEYPVHDHLRDGDLAAHGLAPGFEIDRLGQALLVLGALFAVNQTEPFGGAHEGMGVDVDLALSGDRFVG